MTDFDKPSGNAEPTVPEDHADSDATTQTPTAPSNGARLAQRVYTAGDKCGAWWLRMDPRAWWLTLMVTVLAALPRLISLANIKHLSFDETYYVKDAYSLSTLGYEGKWALPTSSSVDPNNAGAVRDAIDSAFAAGDFSYLTDQASYVVHPQTGKWLISLGLDTFGANSPWGWRIAAALAGIICVTLTCRIAWHLFHRHSATALAGLFLALDGISIVLSRTGLLDVFLTMFTLAAFLCVVIDHRRSAPLLRRRLARFSAANDADDPDFPKEDENSREEDKLAQSWFSLRGLGPHAGARPWLLVAGVMCGLATSVKWSGLYVLAALGLFVVVEEAWIRRPYLRNWLFAGIIVEGVAAFFYLVPTALLTYLGSWWSWFAHPQSWGRRPDSSWLEVLNEWVAYHQQMLQFHSGLSSPHSYMSSAPDWLIQRRPTSFAYDKLSSGCGSSDCVRAVLALGNPIMWWLATGALVAIVVFLVKRLRSGGEVYSAAVILTGLAATYLPWFLYLSRTTFNFYTVVIAPFMALSLAWGLIELGVWGKRRNSLAAALGIGTTVLLVIAAALFFMPIWTGMLISYSQWHHRMWLPTWI